MILYGYVLSTSLETEHHEKVPMQSCRYNQIGKRGFTSLLTQSSTVPSVVRHTQIAQV